MNSFQRWIVGLVTLCCVAPTIGLANVDEVKVVKDSEGSVLQVNDEDFMVLGMNWGYIPIGHNYSYALFDQPEDVIIAALTREMSLLKAMGVNTIRQYVGIPPRWVEYIYERWGIYTVLNHPMARYGFTIDGTWIPSVDYSDPRLRAAVKAEILGVVDEFKDTPGVLMWLLGNENNYGLSWSSFEIEALPEGERNAARARHLYSLFGEVTEAIQARDSLRPVAICNGDLQYIDLIAKECPTIDVFGTNVYRGISARDLYLEVEEKLGVPVLFTEFGSDAFNAKELREDQTMQCRYLVGQWREIYEQSHGKGLVGNCIGGLTFQWSDGWWKYKQEERLDIHDTNASWPNGGYIEDYVEGDNNMNEEWWGITAKGPPDSQGLYSLYPRAAYYALQYAYLLDPYGPDTDLAAIREHFGRISPAVSELQGRGDRAALLAESVSRARVSSVRLEYETISSGGSLTATPETPDDFYTGQPQFQGFDQLHSYYVDFEANPNESVRGMLSVNILGRVPQNSIHEIFYENRGLPRTIPTSADSLDLQGIERVKVYRGSILWDDRNFGLHGFFRDGHFHWGYEGDFFGIYREAFYGPNLDIYNGDAPVGFEFTGKKALNGFALAAGPELWWGANPAIVARYSRRVGRFDATALLHEDIADQATITTSNAIPSPKNRSGTLHLETSYRRFGIEVGGIWSGDTKLGDVFDIAEEDGTGYRVLRDSVQTKDTLGAKAKVTLQKGRWNWYVQSAYMGLVASGGPERVQNFTGWHLKDSGSGNQTNVISGVAVNLGSFQVAPNFLWQKPLVGPVPSDVPPPGRARNILDDPFAVRANRETVGAEVLFTYDPTPATWMWQWDNDVREDARLAASLGFVYRDFKTTQDGSIGVLEDGSTTFGFSGATPPRDLWEVHGRLVSRLSPRARIVAHGFGGMGEPKGDDQRVVRRAGGDVRVIWRSINFESFAKFNDWGPYDYHRDFNNTFPAQLMGDLSYSLGSPQWFATNPQTRIGLRAEWRSLNEFSPRYCPAETEDAFGDPICDPIPEGVNGNEWEIRSYLHFSM